MSLMRKSRLLKLRGKHVEQVRLLYEVERQAKDLSVEGRLQAYVIATRPGAGRVEGENC
jgi:hypothetical protein